MKEMDFAEVVSLKKITIQFALFGNHSDST